MDARMTDCIPGIDRFASSRLAPGILCALVFLILSRAAVAQNCPCPQNCNPCQGGITKLTLVYTGAFPAYVQAWDRTDRLFADFLVKGDTIEISGSLQNSLFRGNVITMMVGLIVEPTFEIRCGTFEVFKPVGSFMMIAAESLQGGKVCCGPNLPYDVTGPVFLSEPTDIEVTITNGCETRVNWTNPDATDCSAVTVTSEPRPGSLLPIGETTVVVTATDAQKNKTTTSFKVRVRDVTAPVFSECPKDIVVTAKDGEGAHVHWKPPVGKDNCKVIEIVSNAKPHDTFLPGVHTITYTARDASGNESKCSFTITVKGPGQDDEPFPIPVGDLAVSRIVTPDGDGVNDFLQIGNIEHFPINRLTIFDRWGNAVFTGENYDNIKTVWQGTGKNSAKLPTGTYFYSLIVNHGNSKAELRGFIELIN